MENEKLLNYLIRQTPPLSSSSPRRENAEISRSSWREVVGAPTLCKIPGDARPGAAAQCSRCHRPQCPRRPQNRAIVAEEHGSWDSFMDQQHLDKERTRGLVTRNYRHCLAVASKAPLFPIHRFRRVIPTIAVR